MASSLQISSYSREELESIISALRSYRVLLRQIGNRSKQIFLSGEKPSCIVQHASNVDISKLSGFVSNIFKKFYENTPPADSIVFQENPHLVGGLRFFIADEMVDISYEHLETMMLLSAQ